MEAEFHRYPPEDLVLTRSERARLEGMEAEAEERCTAFVAGHRTVLALSFGKDSMACLHLCDRAGLLERLVVMWNHSGIETPDTLAMRTYVLGRYPIRTYVETEPDQETLSRTLAMVDLGATYPEREFVYQCLERPRWRAMDDHEIDGTILGLRAAESKPRAITVARKGIDGYWNRREKADILLPLGRWSTEDVFRYAAWRRVPLHPVYRKMAALGFDRHGVRVNTPISLVAHTRGQLAALKRLYPETYRRYLDYVPAIATIT